jgi:parallel beta-helix repeat protein
LQYPNVTIQNCPGILSYENGISLQYASNSTIRNNTLHNSTGFGLYLSSGTSATIINNSIYNNTQHGILLNLSNNISISASQSYNNTQFGIYISQSNNTNLTSNNITENGVGGIWLDSDSVSNTLSSNYVCTNGVDITNTSASSTGDEDTCDSWNGWEENNHPGCTYRCTNLWHVIYGNSTYTVLVLGEEGDTIFEYAWEGTAYNVYAVNEDNAPSLSWTSLTALGRNTTIEPASDDFTELDTLLGTSSEQDNVENTYSTDGTSPLLTTDRLLHYQSVQYIPISNSTNQSAFVTGILWDLSTDTDTEFSAEDNETIVFWAPINSTATGIYGDYDYEIKIPAGFGTYAPGSSGVNIYLELI